MKEPIITDRVKQLISGYLSDSLPPDELSELKAWIGVSSSRKKYFNEMRNTWILSAKDARTDREKERILLELADKLSGYSRRTRRGFWTWQRIAASWAIMIVGAGVSGWYMHDERPAAAESVTVAATTTIQVKMGSQSMVDMPDGTKIWLNGGSRLIYSNTYGEHDREVQLAGEGCFEVTTDPQKPFTVKAGNLSIKAFGTTFNVKAYPEDKTITTTLVKGKVTIEGKDGNDKMFLLEMQPNEKVTCPTERKPQKEPVRSVAGHEPKNAPPAISELVKIENNIKPELYTSWKDDLWVIEKQKLGELSKAFERRYNVRIVFSSESVADYHFSGTIQRETIEQVMKILRRTIPLKYSFDKNFITVSEDQTLMREFHSKNK